jgi:hypothetical protein
LAPKAAPVAPSTSEPIRRSAANANISRIKSTSARFSISSNNAIFSSVIAVLFGYGLLCRNRSLAGFERDDPLRGSYTKRWDGTPLSVGSAMLGGQWGAVFSHSSDPVSAALFGASPARPAMGADWRGLGVRLIGGGGMVSARGAGMEMLHLVGRHFVFFWLGLMLVEP